MAKDWAGKATARLANTRRSAYAALVIERAWPTVLGLACVVAGFLVLSWFGVFAAIPPLMRLAVLGALALCGMIVLWRARKLRLPLTDEVDRRIETVSRLDHRPLEVQSDRPVDGDPFAAALWREHQRRMAERLRNLSGGAPNTRTERFDPLGLRALLALLLVTAFAFSYGARGGRIADAFAAPSASIMVAARVDAWVTPPSYTGRAPIFLTDQAQVVGAQDSAASAGSDQAIGPAAGRIQVPEGSILSVRVSDDSNVVLTFTPESGGAAQTIAPGGLPEMAPDDETTDAPEEAADAAREGTETPTPPAAGEYEFALVANGSAALSTSFRSLGAWSFAVTPDTQPEIAFSAEPSEARNGALELDYAVTDDYGVRSAKAEIAVEEERAPGARALVPVPEVTLAMPRRTKGEAKARTSSDLTDSPYAGAKIAMTLEAVDDAGQTGRSETKRFALPERRFTNPLARAVVEQRRMLALDANSAPRVTEMLDAITLRGAEVIENASDYLALRAVRTRIASAEDDEALVSAVDFLWQIALGIEDGNLSLAEKRLRDAQEKLSEALEKGASDAEIDKLMAELREAMQEYMQAMAEAMKNQPPMSQQDMQSAEEIRPSDLEKMMDRIEDLAKSGSKEAAQQLLAELRQMMDNMQAMRPGQPQQGGEQNAMQEQMDKLGEMLRKQQALKDETFALGREQMQRQQEGQEAGEPQAGENGQQPMTAEELQKRLDQLKAQQGQLKKDLAEMQEAMKGMGMQPGEGLGEAGKAMGEAESALGEGNDGDAVGQQGQAMEALRRGAQDMMQQMQEAMGQGQGQQPGQGQGQGQMGQGQMGQGYGLGEQRSGRDPLGRPRSTQGADFGQDVEVPDEIDTQRARRILDAIRNRLGDALSPQLEREYLERLLRTQ